VGFHFLHAERLLWLAVVLPVVIGLLVIGYRVLKLTRQQYGEARLIDRFTLPLSRRRFTVLGACWVAIATLLVLTIAEPVAPEAPDTVKAGSMDIVAVSDVSWSMQAEDYRGLMPGSPAGSTVADGASGSRLDMTKFLMKQIMNDTPGNRVGIVTYMGEGYPLWDLDDDYSSVRFIVDNFLTPGNAPGGGSDISRGLRQALATFQRDPDPGRTRVIVLFSDGGFDGDKAELAKVLSDIAAANIRLVVVGVGGHQPQAIPRYDTESGAFREFRKDKDGPISTTIDEGSLQQIAQAAGGEYHFVAPGQTTLDVRWASALGGSRSEPQVKPVYGWFLGTAFILLVLLSLSGLSRKRDVL
jgi:Ca-activated chloride channel family protein